MEQKNIVQSITGIPVHESPFIGKGDMLFVGDTVRLMRFVAEVNELTEQLQEEKKIRAKMCRELKALCRPLKPQVEWEYWERVEEIRLRYDTPTTTEKLPDQTKGVK